MPVRDQPSTNVYITLGFWGGYATVVRFGDIFVRVVQFVDIILVGLCSMMKITTKRIIHLQPIYSRAHEDLIDTFTVYRAVYNYVLYITNRPYVLSRTSRPIRADININIKYVISARV